MEMEHPPCLGHVRTGKPWISHCHAGLLWTQCPCQDHTPCVIKILKLLYFAAQGTQGIATLWWFWVKMSNLCQLHVQHVFSHFHLWRWWYHVISQVFWGLKKMHLWNWTWRKKTQVTKISHKVIFHHLPNYLFSRLYGVPMGSMWVFRVLLGNPWKPPDTAAFSPPVVLETPNFPPACGTKIWIWATEIRVVTTKTGGLTNKNDRKRGFNQQKLRFATNKTGDAHQQKLQKEWEYPK